MVAPNSFILRHRPGLDPGGIDIAVLSIACNKIFVGYGVRSLR